MAEELWRDETRGRFFLIPEGRTPQAGPVSLTSLTGQVLAVSAEWLAPYEITEAQAHRVAKHQLGDALGELRGAIDGKLTEWRQRLEQKSREPVREGTTVTPNAGPVLLRLLKDLPRAIGAGLSGDERRIAEARRVMESVEVELKEAGIDVGDRLGAFPDRIASIRTPEHEDHQPGSGRQDER